MPGYKHCVIPTESPGREGMIYLRPHASPLPMTTFSDMNLSKPLLQALEALGLSHPTPIQGEVFPVAMSGRDVAGIARTGTGKTLAYLLPCLRQWTFQRDGNPQILILVPTRELVEQVAAVARSLTAFMSVRIAAIYGGVSMVRQAGEISDGCDVVIATPGRLLDFVLKGTLRLKAIRRVVLDEVDEMLALGLHHQVVQILELLPPKRQHLMFSATLDPDAGQLIRQYFRDPVRIYGEEGPPAKIAIHGWAVPNFHTKANMLLYLLRSRPEMSKVLVFVSTRKQADLLAHLISPHLEEPPVVLHASKAQQQRFQSLARFEEGSARWMIATDIAARGIDFQRVTHVVSLQLPEEPESFIHRMGRTGRAGAEGEAIVLVSDGEWDALAALEDLLGEKIPLALLPPEVDISAQLLPEEKPVIAMKSPPVRGVDPAGGGAFHAKKAKNTKVNQPNAWKNKMKAKYGKPKTRGQKKK